ncbi:hypothetical protein O7602_25050 [Micromonospora sp. WMMD1128]|uniref:hypothetical protein n=1 Tax=unclassified Micromonospora TaxID=2617518 RepID=UPI00248AA1FE|nr:MULTISPECIES: hypothetical protein [unclassified Micromonospora]WBB72928.1 hypothetical protein O7602_25050 [Micromonospora sp. WMMD1128]WFE33624.1 hypothetical protein O7613_29610 [Micromonospora sp. WMMD975]
MNVVTSRPAAPEPSAAAQAGRAARAAPGVPVAPQPRVDPADPTVEVEPTTGAPVDAVPRRVPVRQPRWQRRLAPAGDDAAGWAPIEEVHWDGTPLRDEPRRRAGRARARREPARPVHPPDPPAGLAVLVSLSLLAAFFAWVSAGPLWLAVGHSTSGTVMITECVGGGLTQRCRGIFLADHDRFEAQGVRVSGVPAGRTATGSVLPARMTGPDGATAYADRSVGGHLRWLLGLALVGGCAAGIARWTGAIRLADPRQRRWAVGLALGGPLLITVGFLITAW